jgi:HEAT repeat protein
VRKTLVSAVDEAIQLADSREARMRLERLCDLCAQLHGPDMVDALIRVLDHEDPAVRLVAGEALLDVGYERYAEVAKGVERVLSRHLAGPAMMELPWLLAEIAEPSALVLIRSFLKSADADVVAAAIEALVHLGDPDAARDIEPFVGDSRTVKLEDLDEMNSLGELAVQAIDELQSAGG